ncbi:MAG: hypothetical protein BroJett018_39880 [Chloroflexota bacterium]|nr:MAG: hypothetical protein BroJett018_39880 [Chloroflexota bacterium]
MESYISEKGIRNRGYEFMGVGYISAGWDGRSGVKGVVGEIIAYATLI